MSGGPIRNLPGMLVVSDHMSWLDIVTIAAVLPASRWRAAPASFVGRADVAANLVVRMMASSSKSSRSTGPACGSCPASSTPSPLGCAPVRRWWRSRRAPPGVVWRLGRSIRRCSRRPSTPADRSSRCGCATTTATAGSRPFRPISATTRCCVRLVGCWSPAARWRGSTSNHCSCPVADRRELARRCQAAIRMKATPHPGHGQRRPVLAS